MDFIFNVPVNPVSFVFDIPNTTIGGGGTAGIVNVYLDSILQSTTASSDLDAEIVNILWT